MTVLAELPARAELLVIGAGPAGLAAATEAAALGLGVVLVDESPAPGGQIYRGVDASPLPARILGREYAHGRTLTAAFRTSGAIYLPGAAVWSLSAEGEAWISHGGVSRMIAAEAVIVATGAIERPFPIPGWTLPGVITCGAGQVALKTGGLAPRGALVLAGTGPLLLLLASQYLRAGVAIAALLDTTPAANRRRAAPHFAAFLRSPYARAGLALLWAVRRKVRVIRGLTALRAEGGDHVEAVAYRRGGTEARIRAEHLLLHQGVVPDINLAAATGCKLVWDDRLLCFRPEVDAWGTSSLERIAIAGDGAGIEGARAAVPTGRIAAVHAAFVLGRLDAAARDRRVRPYRAALVAALRGRAFFDALFRPAKSFRLPADDVTLCRCEEVAAREVRDAIATGCLGPNQVKAFTRAGMGPCQGRFCALTVAEMIAEARGVSPAEVGPYHLRPPVKPITLGELASLPEDQAAIDAVIRTDEPRATASQKFASNQ